MSTKNTLRVSFTILEKQMTQMLRFKAKITPNKTATKTANKKCFLVFSTKIAIQQSHIINPLLTSFARSVRESIAFGFYRTDLAPSSLGLYENLRQYFPVQTSHSVNKSLLLHLCCKDLVFFGYSLMFNFVHNRFKDRLVAGINIKRKHICACIRV